MTLFYTFVLAAVAALIYASVRSCKKHGPRSLVITLITHALVALAAFAVADAKRRAELQLLSYQTGSVISQLVATLDQPDGLSIVTNALTRQLQKDTRVKYVHLDEIARSLEHTRK
jgi:hypothetical protein